MENKPKRGRPAGAPNKEKYTLVSLDQLNSMLKGNVCIPVKAQFAASLLGLGLVVEKPVESNVEETVDEYDDIDEYGETEESEDDKLTIPVNTFNFGENTNDE